MHANAYDGDVTSLSELVLQQPDRTEADVNWLHALISEMQLLADLAFADLVLWVPNGHTFTAVSLARPSSSATLFYRDFVGEDIPDDWSENVQEAYSSAAIIDSSALDWFEEIPTRLGAIPVRRAVESGQHPTTPIAVLTRHTNLGQTRTPSRQETASTACAQALFEMVADGTFPNLGAPTGPRRGAPRASDGLIQLDVTGVVQFASPNALSAFNRIGYKGELEGKNLNDEIDPLVPSDDEHDESLPHILGGRSPWRTDIHVGGVTVSLRTIPLRANGERNGAIVLCRDVTELRSQEQELITKDATIREIHHRVKNNLQTVASLLRIQARRATSEEATHALNQAMRRVASIAVVHDTLATGLSQDVDFDEVFDRVLLLVAEVASSHNTTAHTRKTGTFGKLPSGYATPLALALTEIVTNAVEHGLAGKEGTVEIQVERSERFLDVTVSDDGTGLPGGALGEGLGTQIVRTLVEGELGGSIDWNAREPVGTQVLIRIPLRWIRQDNRS